MLPKNEKEALYDVEDRISMLERRLDNARAARDAFVHHLRGKYPNWKPPLPSSSYPQANFSTNIPRSSSLPFREPLAGRLATSDYQWDVEERKTFRPTRFPTNYPSMDIPTSGPLLESDLRRSKIRLREISEELRSMRMDRMNLSTEQWLEAQPFRQNRTFRLNLTDDSADPVDNLENARARLATIDMTETSPVETPTEQRKIELQMTEDHEKLLEELRTSPPKPPAPTPVVSFQEAPPPIIAPVAQPVVQPVVPPIAQAPPTSTLSNLLGQLTKQDSDSDSEDSPRIPAPTTSAAPKLDYSKFLSNLGGAQSSDEDDGFSRPSNSRPAAKKVPAKSMMYDADSDVDDFFN